MNRPLEKHTPYFELLESLENATGCVLCEMRKHSTRRHIDHLLYENVNDPGFRRRLMASGGFCPHHAEVLLACGDGLGTAILYQDQVEETLKFIERLTETNDRRRRGNIHAEWHSHLPCPLCEYEEQNDAGRIGILLENLNDTQLRRALESSPGLCIPHLLKTLEALNNSAGRHYLLELHREKFAQLLEDLKEFIRKQDYRYAHEKPGREADAWRRAPKMILGDR